MSSYFHSASESCRPYFLQIARIIYVCFAYFAVIAQVWINLHRQHEMYFIQCGCERGAKSHVAKEISGRGRRRSRDEKGNQGVGDFQFINILQLFLFISSFQLFLLYHFFYTFLTHDIYAHPHPQPTTSTHYSRPTTFSYTLFLSPKN